MPKETQDATQNPRRGQTVPLQNSGSQDKGDQALHPSSSRHHTTSPCSPYVSSFQPSPWGLAPRICFLDPLPTVHLVWRPLLSLRSQHSKRNPFSFFPRIRNVSLTGTCVSLSLVRCR